MLVLSLVLCVLFVVFVVRAVVYDHADLMSGNVIVALAFMLVSMLSSTMLPVVESFSSAVPDAGHYTVAAMMAVVMWVGALCMVQVEKDA